MFCLFILWIFFSFILLKYLMKLFPQRISFWREDLKFNQFFCNEKGSKKKNLKLTPHATTYSITFAHFSFYHLFISSPFQSSNHITLPINIYQSGWRFSFTSSFKIAKKNQMCTKMLQVIRGERWIKKNQKKKYFIKYYP